MILVVGATGQLGAAVVRKLVERGHSVRALVRESSNYTHLKKDGVVEIVFGDLRYPPSLDAACRDVETLIATANVALPRERGDSFKAVEDRGYKSPIESCRRQGVRHFIYTSVVSQPAFDRLPLPACKRITEQRLRDSGLDYTIFRADAFMDVAFPMMGSDLPLKDAEAATVERGFWFSKRFFDSVRNNIARKGEVGILGDGKARRTYISVDDTAEFLVRAVGHPQARNAVFDLGGPEALSQTEVLAIYQKLLKKPLKAKHTPAVVFKTAYVLLKLFSPAAANLMGLNYVAATTDSVVDMKQTAEIFGVKLTSAEEFLSGELAI